MSADDDDPLDVASATEDDGIMVRSIVVAACVLAGCGTNHETKPTVKTTESARAPSATAPSGSATRPVSTPRPSAKPKASASATPPTKKTRYAKLADADVDELVTPKLKKNETVAHPPFRGPFGPSQDTIVVITKNADQDFAGFVMLRRNNEWVRDDLPVLQESWPGESVEAIGFVASCDGDNTEELVVISRHKSANRTATAVSVIDFDGKGFSHMPEMEAVAAKARTVSEVREMIENKTFILRVDSVPFRVAPTIRPKAIAKRMEKLMGEKPKTQTETSVVIAYSETAKRAPSTFTFSFNDAGVLSSLEVAAENEDGDAKSLNPTAAKLAAWLQKEVGKGEAADDKTLWTHAGWTFTLQTSDKRYAMTVSPNR